ncbi:hypothetical protein ACMC9I_08890 [Deinococcota bacterium DY0809b]
MRYWAACLLLLGAAWASGVEIQPATGTQVGPGAYATLLFTLSGEGEVRPQVVTPEGWQVLPLPERLRLGERTLVAVTLRVPELTPAGSVHPVTLRIWGGERLLAEASADVTVLAKADFILYAEDKQEARMGEPIAYRITVINRGNLRDRITLEAEANTGEAYLRPTVMELNPGQEGTAVLTLQIGDDRRVSPGYTMITWVRARSGFGSLERKVRVTTRWLDPYALGAGGPDPTLRVGLSGSVGVGALLEAGQFASPVFRYSIRPNLSGRLSDFVETSLSTSAFGGRSPRWWPEAPSSLALGLKGPKWDAALSATTTGMGLRTGFQAEGWRYGVGLNGRYDLGAGGFAVSAVSTRRSLNLQLNASVEAAQGSRQDRFGIDYSRTLNRSLSLRLGGRLNGILSGGYTLIGTAHQGLLWQGARFSVLQSLSASPQLGLYTLTLTGGTRSVYPLGVRGTAHLQQRPEGLGWKASSSVFATPMPRTSLRVTTTLEQAAGRPFEFSLNPSLAVRPPNLAGVRSSFGVGYKLRYVPADGSAHQVATLSARLGYGNFGLSVSGNYTLVGPHAYGAQLGVRWRPWPLTVLRATYAVKLADAYSETLGVGWQQYWGAGFASELDLERGEADRLSFYLAQKSLFGSPIGLLVGYAVSDSDGLGRGAARLSHRFSVQLGYDFAWRFPTPEAVVSAFGGRKVGRVRGVAFIDRNLNGVQDEDEPPVPGLTVRLGGASAETDENGRYVLEARPGVHTPQLEGLPATLDLYRPTELRVEEGRRYLLDLPLAPTAQILLVLFHDANHNGVQDEGERGIPYGGVRLVGPSTRSFRTDERGRALATGLLPGVYEVAPDPDLLPPRFRATSAPTRVELQSGKSSRVVRIGAAPPPKQVRTTYDPGKLAVFATLPSPIVAAGAEFELRAIAQGDPEQVWLVLDGTSYPLQRRDDGTYTVRVRMPPSTPTGPLMLKVRAGRGSEVAETVAVATVVQRPLYELDPVKFQVGQPRRLELTLLFRATSVRLVIGEEAGVEFTSKDGYRWFAEWTPERAGAFEAYVVADGEALSQSRITVLPASTGEK